MLPEHRRLALFGACLAPLIWTADALAQEADVLFVVLGKMALYDQRSDGKLALRDFHFVAEIMPKQDGTILGGTLHRQEDPSDLYRFEEEGEAFLAHGGRFDTLDALHEAHPDGAYVFSYETASGKMDAQVVELAWQENMYGALGPAQVTLSQSVGPVSPDAVAPEEPLVVSWTRSPGMTSRPESLLDDLVFVLAFDCFGERIAHSGRPFQGGGFLTYRENAFIIPAEALSHGLRYSLIVEQATADATRHEGVPSIATYANLTFLDFQTTGDAARACPAESP